MIPFMVEVPFLLAEKLTYQDKRKYMNFAIISACYGTVIQRVLSESGVFIIYASALGAGKFLTLITTALIPCMILVFLVPFAYLGLAEQVTRIYKERN